MQSQIRFIIEHCTFNSNIAEYGSGVYMYTNTVYGTYLPSKVRGSQIIISDTLFFENTATIGGGAIYLSIGWNTNLPFILKSPSLGLS